MLVEWLGNPSKALYKPSIMFSQAKEGSNFSVGLWRSIFGNSPHIDVTGSNTFLGHLVGQVIYFLLKQATLQWF